MLPSREWAFCLVLCFASLFLSFANAQVKVLSPPSLVTQIEATNTGSAFLLGATATFGAPSYGESFVGRVVTGSSASAYCKPDYLVPSFLSPSAPVESNTTAETNSGGSESPPSPDGLKKIFLIRRGGCTFVKKVTAAESLGADAVIFVDVNTSPWTRNDINSVIMADDGFGRDVKIPSVLITYEDGQILFDASNGTEPVIVQFLWSLPQKSVVALDFWMEAGSTTSQRFLKDYAYHALLLGGRLKFTPHFHVFSLPVGSPDLSLCLPGDTSICSNPSDVFGSNVSGRDVLYEETRQLCILKLTAREADNISGSRMSLEWWEYVRRLPEYCPMTGVGTEGSSNVLGLFGEKCSFALMAKIPGISVADVAKCAATEGKELLLKEKEDRAWSALAVRINGAKFSGSLDPLQVSKAVCIAFQTPPDECKTLTGTVEVAPPAPHRSGMSTGSFIVALACAGALATGALYIHQHYLRNSMRHALRHEVMMEVKTQLQEYHQLGEDQYDPLSRQKRPLMSG